jgi:hypothetical protein
MSLYPDMILNTRNDRISDRDNDRGMSMSGP